MIRKIRKNMPQIPHNCMICGKFIRSGCNVEFFDPVLLGEGYGEFFPFCDEHAKPIADWLKQYLKTPKRGN